MGWFYLALASVFEIAWAIGLKHVASAPRLVPILATAVSAVLSLVLLGLAIRTLPLGTAYAVWTGIGTIGTVALGIALYGEPMTAMRLACIALIVIGVAGLKLA